MNQRTGGVGLTLTQARTVIYYSNGYSLRLRMQSEDRAHRGGLTHSVNYIDIMSPGTVDEKVISAFESKIDIASQIVPLYDYFMGEKVLTPEEREALAKKTADQEGLQGLLDLSEEEIEEIIAAESR
jgi:SNF2 family DNA or RNA helicase